MADYSARLSAIAPRLKAAPLYARAQRAGLDNPPWGGARARFLVARLSPFRDAARSTGHLFLHRLVRSVLGPDAYIDFSFFPAKADRAILDGEALPYLTGIVSARSMEDFDAVLVSCSYALELPNLPLFLHRSGIPLRASERRAGGRSYPPLILGGSNALASQALIFPDGDSFVDGIFFGEGESGGGRLVALLAESAAAVRSGRPGTTEALCERLETELDAFWASCRGAPESPRADGAVRRVKPARCAVADAPLLLDSYPLFNSEEASTARLQLSWGCPSFCSFCFEGWERKPYRELPRQRVLEAARRLKAESGASTADLYSFNFNAHQDILELIEDLNGIFDRVNMMSQRADLLIRTPGMVSCELAAEKRAFTVGVEGISAAMRSYYSKDLSDEDLRALLERLVKEKVRELKLFYILSGTEGPEDFADFDAFCRGLRGMAESRFPGLRAVFSFGYLVRMPFTPLRAEALALDRESYRAGETACRAAVEAAGFEFRLAADWNEYLADQLLVSGDYVLAGALEAAARAGCAFDLKLEGDLVPRLVAALESTGALSRGGDGRLAGPLAEEKDASYRYPLSFVDTAVSPDFRSRSFSRARGREDTRSCLGDNGGSCLACGACADGAERSFLTAHRVKGAPAQAAAERISALIGEKRKRKPRFFSVVLPDFLSGAENEFLAAYLLRETLRADPSLAPDLFRAEEAFRTTGGWKERLPAGFVGEAVAAVYAGGAADEARIAAALSRALGCAAEPLESFSASDIEGMELEIDLPGDAQAAASRARRWLAALRLSATERKTEQGRAFDIAPKDRKKRVVEALETRGTKLLVRCGAKIDAAPLFLKAADAAPSLFRTGALRGLRRASQHALRS